MARKGIQRDTTRVHEWSRARITLVAKRGVRYDLIFISRPQHEVGPPTAYPRVSRRKAELRIHEVKSDWIGI